MPKRAWAYIWTVLLTGALLSGLAGPGLAASPLQWLTFAGLVALATFAQLFEAEAPKRQSFYPAMVFLFAGVLLLPPALFAALVVIPHLIEWAKARLSHSPRLRAWYIQPFNIANHIIAGIAAKDVARLLDANLDLYLTPAAVPAVVLGAIVYVIVNHLLIGQVLVLARGISWRDSGILAVESLVTDVILTLLGYIVAVLWQINPWLIAPALSPLVLMHRALLVPKLQEEAQTDAKTGLWNARHFTTLFTAELERARRFERPLALIVADLDLLRNINNTYGHLAGDAVLAGIGAQIRRTVREYDIAARFGGEEFVIALPETVPAEAQAIAERIRQHVEAARFPVATSPTPIGATLSLGLANFPGDATEAEALIHAADAAVYRAKYLGRNRVIRADDAPAPGEPVPALDASPAAPPMAGFARRLQSADAAPYTPPQPARPPARPVAPGAGPTAATDAGHSGTATPGPRRASLAVLRLFVGAVIAAGIGTTLLGVSHHPQPDLLVILLLAGLAALAERFQVSVYGENTVSASVALVIAAALTAGIPGVAIVSLGIVLVDHARRRPPVYRTAFNWAIHLLAGAAPVLVMASLNIPLQVSQAPVLVVVIAGVALVYFAIETGLIATALGLAQGEPLTTKWRRQFQWLAVHYLVLGVLGLFLSLGYQALGWVGIVAFALPVLMMRYAQKQYVDHTEQVVGELQHLNSELVRANRDVMDAGKANRQLNAELFLTLAKIVDSRDPSVASHATRVADYAVAIAAEVGLPAERIEPLRQAGLLHDIGKVAISDQILTKPTRLTDEEYEAVKAHAALGGAFLETCHGLRDLAPFVRHHHERWDGCGYPDRLLAEAIPLEARILAVCDAVEAMASDRPYQSARPGPAILAELQRCAGTQFDPTVVEAFVRLVVRCGDGFITNSAPRPGGRQADHPQPRDANYAERSVVSSAA